MFKRCTPFALFVLFVAGSLSAAVPTGFSDDLFTNVAAGSAAFTFTPDGRTIILVRTGIVRIHDGNTLLTTPALNIASKVCSNSERGLLGVALHPDFETNQYVYLYYTHNSPTAGCVNRVSRFTLGDDNLIPAASEVVLIDNVPNPNGNHNAGDLGFGRDGMLYISTGDGGCDYAGDSGCAGANNASRDLHALVGKILRIAPDGSIPADNPFTGAGTARCNTSGVTSAGLICQETFMWGLRNPFRFAFDVNAAGVRMYVNDVGEGAREEIDLSQPGGDYGWNCKEGTANTGATCTPTPPNMIPPIFEWAHGATIPGTTSPTNCRSITGAAFVPNGHWPAYDGQYLFGDFICQEMFQLSPANTAADFASAIGGVVHMGFGPWGNNRALYYLQIGGAVRRVSLSPQAGNAPPNPVTITNVNGQYGDFPRQVTFTASATDPNGGTLTYFWDFGDGTPVQQTTSTSISHAFADGGAYKVTVRARDPFYEFSAPDTVYVRGGTSAKGDFNSDVRADVVWQNNATGQNVLWRMNGMQIASSAPIPSAGSVDWKIAASGDMDRDGDADLVWQHATSGSNYVWFMNDNSFVSGTNLNNAGSVNWKIVAVDDFNQDGHADLFFQHATTAQNYLWHMNGLNLTEGLNVNNAGTAWRVAGAADFNTDGYPDLVYRNQTTGENMIWFMQDNQRLLEQPIPRVADTNWRIAAVGDFTGEGRPDLLWQYAPTGQLYMWVMEGRRLASHGNVNNLGSADWVVAAPN